MLDEPMMGIDDRELDVAGLEALAEAYAVAPSARLRGRILDAVRREDGAERTARSLRRWRLVGSVAAVAVLALATLFARASRLASVRGAELDALAGGNTALVARLDEQDRILGGLRRSVSSQREAMKVLAAPSTRTATLLATGQDAGGAASARVLVDAASGDAALVVSGLRPPPADRTYELWAIRGERPPEPAGVFAVDSDATLVTRIDRLPRPDEVTAFAVSIEPAGGSSSPTGAIVLAGPVAG